jgi:NDP-sugar pyrophosphorylase family protein
MPSPFHPRELLDASATAHWELFESLDFAWQALPQIREYLTARLQPANHGTLLGQASIGEQVYIGPGTKIEPGAVIHGPAWIGANCEIRPGAYIRGHVIAGDGCVLGNSCEFKNCVLFDHCQVPHFSYVGDSILGARAHLGAGVICSNLKLDGSPVVIRHEGASIDTGLRKFGAILGDHAEVGCNAVLNPGSVLGRRALVYPAMAWRGVLPAAHIAKPNAAPMLIARRD